MKKAGGWLLTLALVLTVAMMWFTLGNWLSTAPAVDRNTPDKQSIEPQQDDVLLTILAPYIEIAIAGRYGTENNYAIQTAPYVMEILSIEQPDTSKHYTYLVKVKVEPYANAHITVGQDILTFAIDPSGIYLSGFHHTKDYQLPEFLQ